MTDEIRARLTDQLNDYLAYWKCALENVEKIHPRENRSRELNDIMSGLKTLIGTYSISENISDFVSGNSSANFDPVTQRLSQRLLPTEKFNNTPEKKFIADCFNTDNKENAAKLLRFINMVEFETSTLHYAIIARDWLQEEDIRIAAYYQGQQGLSLEIKELTELLQHINQNRQNTEQLFYTHWTYTRNKSLRDRTIELSTGLRAAKDAVSAGFASEEKDDAAVKKTADFMLEQLKSFQENVNKVLTEEDQKMMVESPVKEDSSFSIMGWLTPVKDSSGLTKSQIRDFQKSEKYVPAEQYIQETMGKLFSGYNQILTMLRRFEDRERTRRISEAKVGYWHAAADQLVSSFLNQDSARCRIPELFSRSMYVELQKSTTTQTSLCEKFEQFMIARASILADGNWGHVDEIHSAQSPKDCLKRENIAKFRKNMVDYKIATKSRRLLFSRINKALIFMGLVSCTYLAMKGIIMILPASLQASPFAVQVISALSIPTSIMIIVPLAICVLIGMNWRNSKKMKEVFRESLNTFTEDSRRGQMDNNEVRDNSYFSMLCRGLGSMCSYLNCFRSSPSTTQEEYSERGEFIGVQGKRYGDVHTTESHNIETGGANKHIGRYAELPDEYASRDQANTGRYGAHTGFFGRRVSSYDENTLETVDLHSDDGDVSNPRNGHR